MTPLAVVTGGSRGIGRAIVDRLIESGCECLVIGLSEPEATAMPVTFVHRDLSDAAEVAKAANDIRRHLRERGGPASVLVNNAGGASPQPARNIHLPDVQATVTLNLVAAIELTNAVLDGMEAAGDGVVINVASTAGRSGVAYLPAYSAAKAGLIAYTQSLAAECTSRGVRAHCVCPGAVATSSACEGRDELSRLHGMEPGTYQAAMQRRTGLGRLVTPDEVADVVRWLALHAGPALSGQTLNVCGTLEMG